MRSFKSTYIFLILVVAVAAFAVYDYQQQKQNELSAQNNKKLFPQIELKNVHRLQLNGPQKFVIEKKDGRWNLLAPVEDLADQEAVNSYLSRIFEQEVVRLPSEELKDMDQYGFQTPFASIEFMTSEASHVITVGTQRSFNDGYYLRRDAEKDLYVGSSGWTELVLKLPDELRNKFLFLNSNELSNIKVQSEKGLLELTNQKDLWFIEGQPEFPLSQEEVEDYLLQIKTLRAESITQQNPPNRKADLIIKAQRKDESQWAIQIWKTSDTEALAKVESWPSTYKLSRSKVSFLDRADYELKDKQAPFKFRRDDVASFKYNNAAVETDNVRTNSLIGAVKNLRVQTYRPKSKKDFKHKLELFDKTGGTLFKMEWSEPFEIQGSQVVIAKTALHESAFTVAAQLVNELALASKSKEVENQ